MEWDDLLFTNVSVKEEEGGMMEKCDKHDVVMDRLFSEIGEIRTNVTVIKTQMESITAFKDSIHEIIFGNGKEGLKDKIARVCSQINLQWTLILLVIGSILGYCVRNMVR